MRPAVPTSHLRERAPHCSPPKRVCDRTRIVLLLFSPRRVPDMTIVDRATPMLVFKYSDRIASWTCDQPTGDDHPKRIGIKRLMVRHVGPSTSAKGEEAALDGPYREFHRKSEAGGRRPGSSLPEGRSRPSPRPAARRHQRFPGLDRDDRCALAFIDPLRPGHDWLRPERQ